LGIGSYIFEFIGVSFRWIVGLIYSLFTRRKPRSFSEILSGKESLSGSDLLLYGFINIALGVVIFLIIAYIIE